MFFSAKIYRLSLALFLRPLFIRKDEKKASSAFLHVSFGDEKYSAIPFWGLFIYILRQMAQKKQKGGKTCCCNEKIKYAGALGDFPRAETEASATSARTPRRFVILQFLFIADVARRRRQRQHTRSMKANSANHTIPAT